HHGRGFVLIGLPNRNRRIVSADCGLRRWISDQGIRHVLTEHFSQLSNSLHGTPREVFVATEVGAACSDRQPPPTSIRIDLQPSMDVAQERFAWLRSIPDACELYLRSELKRSRRQDCRRTLPTSGV